MERVGMPRVKERHRPFSLADCTSDATSPNGTVIARNPIYQDSLRPSSVLCTASRRFSLCHSSRFLPFRSSRRRVPNRRRTSSTVVALSGTFTMSRGLRALRTKNGEPRCRHYFSLSSATAVIIFLTLLPRAQHRPLFSTPIWKESARHYDTEISRNFANRAIAGSMDIIADIDLKPRHHFKCASPQWSAITFHVPISLIRHAVIALFAATCHFTILCVRVYVHACTCVRVNAHCHR